MTAAGVAGIETGRVEELKQRKKADRIFTIPMAFFRMRTPVGGSPNSQVRFSGDLQSLSQSLLSQGSGAQGISLRAQVSLSPHPLCKHGAKLQQTGTGDPKLLLRNRLNAFEKHMLRQNLVIL